MSGRCCACDAKLSSFELTRRYEESKQFVNLCNRCFSTIPDFPAVIERMDLVHAEDVHDD